MLIKKHLNHDVLLISVLSVITITVWIGLAVYQSLHSPIVSKLLKEQLKPINSDFDTELINDLNLRTGIDENLFNQIPKNIKLDILEENGNLETNVSTASAQINNDNDQGGKVASESGTQP